MAQVAKNCMEYEDPAATTKLKPMHASVQDLKNGSWYTNTNNGLPGTISNVKMSKTGKHGHAKFTFHVAYPMNSSNSQEMWPGHTHLTRPEISKYELFVSAYDPFMEDEGGIDNDDDIQDSVTCLNDKNEEVFAVLHPHWKKDSGAKEQFTGAKFLADWKKASDYDDPKEMVLSIIDGPIKVGKDKAKMCRMVEKWQLKDIEDN